MKTLKSIPDLIVKLTVLIMVIINPYNSSSQTGSNDATFNITDSGETGGIRGADGQINLCIVQSNSKILIAGNFLNYNGKPSGRVAKLNLTGKADATFNAGTGADNEITAMALQSNKKIVLGGKFTHFNDTQANHLVRIHANGGIDSNFKTGTGTNGQVKHILLQPDEKILVAGTFNTYNGKAVKGLMRLNKNGSYDSSFQPSDSFALVFAMAIQSDGKILVSYEENFFRDLIRLNSDGSRDSTFISSINLNNPFLPMLNVINVQPDGKILAGGKYQQISATGSFLHRLLATGAFDNTFEYSTPESYRIWINSITLQADGRIVLGGRDNLNDENDNSFSNYIARLDNTGKKDPSFNNADLIGNNTTIYATALQDDGKIMVAGLFIDAFTHNNNHIARLNLDGSTDYTFNKLKGANGMIRTMSIQTNGKLIIGGNFTTFNCKARNHIARLTSDGDIDNTFLPGTGANNIIHTTAIGNDGKIFIGGEFNKYNGINSAGIARLDKTGLFDATFVTGSGFDGPVYTILALSNGKVIAGGDFHSYNGTPVASLVRLNPDGSLDANFFVSVKGIIYTSILLANEKILIGGNFAVQYKDAFHSNLLRLNNDGNIDSTFEITSIPEVHSISLNSNNKIVAGGGYEAFRLFYVGYVARLLENGKSDETFIAAETGGMGSYTDYVRTVSTTNNDKILIGGEFSTYNGLNTSHVGQLNSDGSKDTEFISGTNNSVWSSALLPDGRILIGGDFITYNSIQRNGIARLLPAIITNAVQPEASINNEINGDKQNTPVLHVYPNPAAHFITIDPIGENSTLMIRNTLGTVIASVKLSAQQKFVLELDNYPNGIYFISIESEGQKNYAKFIVSK